MMGLRKKNKSHPDRGYVQLVDDEIYLHQTNRIEPPHTLPTPIPNQVTCPSPLIAFIVSDAAVAAIAAAGEWTKSHNVVRSGIVSDFQGFTTRTETENDNIDGKRKICRSKRSTLRSKQSGEESHASIQVLKLTYELEARDKIEKERKDNKDKIERKRKDI